MLLSNFINSRFVFAATRRSIFLAWQCVAIDAAATAAHVPDGDSLASALVWQRYKAKASLHVLEDVASGLATCG